MFVSNADLLPFGLTWFGLRCTKLLRVDKQFKGPLFRWEPNMVELVGGRKYVCCRYQLRRFLRIVSNRFSRIVSKRFSKIVSRRFSRVVSVIFQMQEEKAIDM